MHASPFPSAINSRFERFESAICLSSLSSFFINTRVICIFSHLGLGLEFVPGLLLEPFDAGITEFLFEFLLALFHSVFVVSISLIADSLFIGYNFVAFFFSFSSLFIEFGHIFFPFSPLLFLIVLLLFLHFLQSLFNAFFSFSKHLPGPFLRIQKTSDFLLLF